MQRVDIAQPAGQRPSARRRKAVGQPTIDDVARFAGVSTASVSRVLNGHQSPRPETRERVLAAALELGFAPESAARIGISRRKQVVSVVFRGACFDSGPIEGPGFAAETDNLIFMDVVNRGIEYAAHAKGYDLLFSLVDAHRRLPTSRLGRLAAKSDGIILHDTVLDTADIVRLAGRTPVVTLAGTPTRVSVDIAGDNAAGMRELTEHLLGDHGYRSIGYLSGHRDSPDNMARSRAVRQAAAAFGVQVADGPLWTGDYSVEGGARVIHRLMESRDPLPRSICCANDQSALGVIRALREHGLSVPGDVAVTGFDDLSVAWQAWPALTTVRQPLHLLGAQAFEVLYAMISGHKPPERQVLHPVNVVYRSSCGCPSGPVFSQTPQVRAGAT